MTYSISEFSSLVQVSPSTLRYYEQEQLISPERNENNIRRFTDADIGWVKFLLHLKNTGMSMAELKQYTCWRSMGDQTLEDRKKLLEERKYVVEQELKHLQENLVVLDRKIAFYEDRLQGYDYEFVL